MIERIATPPVRGRVEAAAYLIDPAVLGEEAGRQRVLSCWRPGAELRQLPDGPWLLVLNKTQSERAEHAPGLPVQSDVDGRLVIHRGGSATRLLADDLPRVDTADWVDLADLPLLVLAPVRGAGVVLVSTPPELPPVRSSMHGAAGVALDPNREAVAKMLGLTESDAESRPRTTRPPRGLQLTRLMLSIGPLARIFMARHERYLHELADDFAHARFDEALRRAIALTGTGQGLSVRLPSPRRGVLKPTATPSSGGRAAAVAATSLDFLRALYVQAVEDLERLGRIEEAAFVRADLLNQAMDGVLLLERHGRFGLAGELALGRKLDPAIAVRLWWKAGDRERAIDVARLHNSFASAVDRLTQTDPEDAYALRAEWVDRLLEAGDVHAAVDAAWAQESLRPKVIAHFGAAMAVGGASGARLLAHWVTQLPAAEPIAASLALLNGSAAELAPARTAFLTAFAGLRTSDPGVDRRLASAALRVLVREPGLLRSVGKSEVARIEREVRARADRMLSADVAPIVFAGSAHVAEVFDISAVPTGGRLRIADAAALPGGVLVALGPHGVRLLSADGRVRARWDISAERLVVADHGGVALLLSWGETSVDVHRLELGTRRVRHWATLSALRVVSSFDGALLTVVDHAGLSIVDTTGARPRIVWRELEAGVEVLALERDHESMSAVVRGVAISADLVPQLWVWDLPSMTLRHRNAVTFSPAADERPVATALTAGAGMAAVIPEAGGLLDFRLQRVSGSVTRGHGGDVVQLLSSGRSLALVRDLDEEGLAVELIARPVPRGPDRWPKTLGIVRLPGATAVAVRQHGDVVTVYDDCGRVVAVGEMSGRVVANLVIKG